MRAPRGPIAQPCGRPRPQRTVASSQKNLLLISKKFGRFKYLLGFSDYRHQLVDFFV
jgi:hypothetical protein